MIEQEVEANTNDWWKIPRREIAQYFLKAHKLRLILLISFILRFIKTAPFLSNFSFKTILCRYSTTSCVYRFTLIYKIFY